MALEGITKNDPIWLGSTVLKRFVEMEVAEGQGLVEEGLVSSEGVGFEEGVVVVFRVMVRGKPGFRKGGS